jgi:hypothetical protein
MPTRKYFDSNKGAVDKNYPWQFLLLVTCRQFVNVTVSGGDKTCKQNFRWQTPLGKHHLENQEKEGTLYLKLLYGNKCWVCEVGRIRWGGVWQYRCRISGDIVKLLLQNGEEENRKAQRAWLCTVPISLNYGSLTLYCRTENPANTGPVYLWIQ